MLRFIEFKGKNINLFSFPVTLILLLRRIMCSLVSFSETPFVYKCFKIILQKNQNKIRINNVLYTYSLCILNIFLLFFYFYLNMNIFGFYFFHNHQSGFWKIITYLICTLFYWLFVTSSNSKKVNWGNKYSLITGWLILKTKIFQMINFKFVFL